MVSRTWEVGDQVAIRDYVDQPWQLATIVEISPSSRLVLRGKGVPDLIREPDDARVIPADQVPVDERHWLPETVRDQLVRQEAAERLARVIEALVEDEWPETRIYLDGLVQALASGVDPDLAAPARALLAPATAPATTP